MSSVGTKCNRLLLDIVKLVCYVSITRLDQSVTIAIFTQEMNLVPGAARKNAGLADFPPVRHVQYCFTCAERRRQASFVARQALECPARYARVSIHTWVRKEESDPRAASQMHPREGQGYSRLH